MAGSESSPSFQYSMTRMVYAVAIVTFILLWLLAWQWQDEPIVPTEQRNPQWPVDDHVVLEPLTTEIPTDTQTHLCTTDQYNEGEWIKRPLNADVDTPEDIARISGYHCPHNFPHKCYMRVHEGNEFNRSRHMLEYVWQPSDCTLLPFDAQRFASYIADHPLLFIGDSINQLQFESLACLLGESLREPKSNTNLSAGRPDMWVSQRVHQDKTEVEGAVSLGYLRSDYLVRLDDFKLMDPLDEEGYIIGKGSNFPWKHAISRFDHIVINTGPHWNRDLKWGPHKSNEELLEAYTKAMRIVFDYLKDNLKPTQRLYVRSTPYGHAKCSRYTEPDKIPHAPSGKPGEYQWDMHEKFDYVWKNWILEANDPRFHFFNVSYMSNLRGDAHSRPDTDCLHTCIPGPVDDWNRLLYHEMARVTAGIA